MTKILCISFRRILCFDPQQRLETEGMPVPVSDSSPVSSEIVTARSFLVHRPPFFPSKDNATVAQELVGGGSRLSRDELLARKFRDCSQSTMACILAIWIFGVIFEYLS